MPIQRAISILDKSAFSTNQWQTSSEWYLAEVIPGSVRCLDNVMHAQKHILQWNLIIVIIAPFHKFNMVLFAPNSLEKN